MLVDQTPAFREVLAERTPPAARSKSPAGRGSSRTRAKGKERESDDDGGFLQEAYRIHTHLSSLLSLLTSVRRAYLSLADPPSASRQARRPPRDERLDDGTLDPASDRNELLRWQSSKYLTDREREELDLRGRMVVRRCRERVGVLEEGERARQTRLIPPPTLLHTLLPSLAPSPSSPSEPLITAHRASVLWTLNALLAKATAGMSELQEERARRRAERGRTLGEGASREAATMGAQGGAKVQGAGGSSASNGFELSNGNSHNHIAGRNLSSVSSPAGTSSHPLSDLPHTIDGPPDALTLTPAQLLLFESENNALLTHMQSQLDSVLAAEKSLLEISTLQAELVRHLAQQTEMVERLYDEAVGSVGEVGKANEQLKKAKERGGEARLFLLVFLVGASMALLFLDWYA